jgi:Icc-related predicted phosphoesterase
MFSYKKVFYKENLILLKITGIKMKLFCISDLHGEAGDIGGLTDADALIVCGDITHFGHDEEAKELLNPLKDAKRILAVPGNCDNFDVNDALVDLDVDLHARGRIINGVGFFGLGGSNATPFNTPQEYKEDELLDFIMEGYEQVKDAPFKVFVTHTPAIDTKVDDAGGGRHVGSVKVREFVEKYQPDLVLCGHVHEARGQDMLGKTVMVNPGMLRNGHALIELGEDIKVEFF